MNVINRSKPPALPGRHAKFDNFGKIIKPHAREPLKAHGKEGLNEKRSEFKSHKLGLQVAFGLDSKMSQKSALW